MWLEFFHLPVSLARSVPYEFFLIRIDFQRNDSHVTPPVHWLAAPYPPVFRNDSAVTAVPNLKR